MHRVVGLAVVVAALGLWACQSSTIVPASPTSLSARPTAQLSPAPPASLTLHWMSFESHTEPHYRLLYEGGGDLAFTSVRLLAADGTLVAQADAVSTASLVMRMCARSVSYGPIRATLALPTQQLLGDVIRDPGAYRVEARVSGQWLAAAVVNECHAQE